jgi:hypothetical protein
MQSMSSFPLDCLGCQLREDPKWVLKEASSMLITSVSQAKKYEINLLTHRRFSSNYD